MPAANGIVSNPETLLHRVQRLKEWAIEHSYPVSDETVALIDDISVDAEFQPENQKKLDRALKELTQITYPEGLAILESDGVSTINRAPSMNIATFWSIAWFSIVSSFGTVVAILLITHFEAFVPIALSIFLGLLGAVSYFLINVTRGRIILIGETTTIAALRFLLGGFVGLVFYLGFPTQVASMPLLPFLAGFSTDLVMDVLNRLIDAARVALGLDNERGASARSPTKSTR